MGVGFEGPFFSFADSVASYRFRMYVKGGFSDLCIAYSKELLKSDKFPICMSGLFRDPFPSELPI